MISCSICGGRWTLEYTEQIYPDDPDALSIERHRCTNCGATGTHKFGTVNGQIVEKFSGDIEADYQ